MAKWTKDEEEELIQGWPVKEHRDSIAEELGRSKAACAARYRKLIKETPAKDLTGDAYVEKIRQMKEEVVEEVKEAITPTKAAQEISEKITEIIEQNEAELVATNGKLKEVKEELKEEQISNVIEVMQENKVEPTRKGSGFAIKLLLLVGLCATVYWMWMQ